MSYIEIENLTHIFQSGAIGFQNINLSIEKGEFVVIAGENGSGKTTFCRHLNCLLSPSQGSIKIEGKPIHKDRAGTRQKVGMVFQNADTQIVGETVSADIAFGPENLKLEREEIRKRVKKALEVTNLQEKENASPHTLSGGEKRKLAIAGVLAMNPDVLVFDEPFSNLDYPGSKLILHQIVELHKAGHTIILITHELEKVVSQASRLVIFQKGRIVEEGDPSSIISSVENYGVREPCSSKLGHGISSWLN